MPSPSAERLNHSSNRLQFNLRDLFARSSCPSTTLIGSAVFARTQTRDVNGTEVLADCFGDDGVLSAFLRVPGTATGSVALALEGRYRVATCPAGGWLISPRDAGLDSYWTPQPPCVRRLDRDGHILSYQFAKFRDILVSPMGLAVEIDVPRDCVLDIVLWRLPTNSPDLAISLSALCTLERQRYFLLSSHTAYERPADLYLHLVHGHVYENHEVWPKYWRVCSELDAYSLYLITSALERATGRRLYTLLKRQIVFSTITRQSRDGGWYHGEWTDQMESHYRLHTAGTLMLADYLEANPDIVVRQALEKAAAFSASKTDTLKWGSWFLHDSLEQGLDTAKLYPFAWIPSRAFAKSSTNMLILNTHLDTAVSLERYGRVTGDKQYTELVASAGKTTQGVLQQRTTEWLYRPLFRAIGLTMLPKSYAQTLPLPVRALKRIAWKYLIPLLPRIKTLYPRLVMPGGFVDRSLSQVGMSYRYQSVNLMDLARTRRIFGEPDLDRLLATVFEFTQKSGIRGRWKEMRGIEDDSLGFWAEALYHMCLASPELKYRAWLAETMIDLEDNELGLAPSLLGANSEATPSNEQIACPSPMDPRLRVANLSRHNRLELVIVNTANRAISLEWGIPPAHAIVWKNGDQTLSTDYDRPLEVPSRGWLHGMHAKAEQIGAS